MLFEVGRVQVSLADCILFAYMTGMIIWLVRRMDNFFYEMEADYNHRLWFVEDGDGHFISRDMPQNRIVPDERGVLAEFTRGDGTKWYCVMVPQESWTKQLRQFIMIYPCDLETPNDTLAQQAKEAAEARERQREEEEDNTFHE